MRIRSVVLDMVLSEALFVTGLWATDEVMSLYSRMLFVRWSSLRAPAACIPGSFCKCFLSSLRPKMARVFRQAMRLETAYSPLPVHFGIRT